MTQQNYHAQSQQQGRSPEFDTDPTLWMMGQRVRIVQTAVFGARAALGMEGRYVPESTKVAPYRVEKMRTTGDDPFHRGADSKPAVPSLLRVGDFPDHQPQPGAEKPDTRVTGTSDDQITSAGGEGFVLEDTVDQLVTNRAYIDALEAPIRGSASMPELSQEDIIRQQVLAAFGPQTGAQS